jgi:Homeodomain-like domain
MAYISPTKVAWIVEQKQQGWSHQDIAKSIHIHRTTISRILNWFEKSHDYYHINPKTGHPCKMDLRESHIATQIIAWVEAANAIECYDFFHIQHIITHPSLFPLSTSATHTLVHKSSVTVTHVTSHITLTHIMAYIIMTSFMTHTLYL